MQHQTAWSHCPTSSTNKQETQRKWAWVGMFWHRDIGLLASTSTVPITPAVAGRQDDTMYLWVYVRIFESEDAHLCLCIEFMPSWKIQDRSWASRLFSLVCAIHRGVTDQVLSHHVFIGFPFWARAASLLQRTQSGLAPAPCPLLSKRLHYICSMPSDV